MALEHKNWMHACGQIASDGTVGIAGTGNWSSVRNGAGDYTITWAAESLIDATQCVVLATPRVTSTSVAVIAQTDTTVQFSVESDASGATDAAVDFLVIRN